MEANEAPEKIYLNPLLMEDGESVVRRRTFERQRDSQIEYTRTDAFIEKARKWFEKQNEWLDLNGNRHCDMESFEDFRKYMEGE